MIFQNRRTSESTVAEQRGCQLVDTQIQRKLARIRRMLLGSLTVRFQGSFVAEFRLEDSLNSTKRRVSPPEEFGSFACVMNINDAMMQTLHHLYHSTN